MAHARGARDGAGDCSKGWRERKKQGKRSFIRLECTAFIDALLIMSGDKGAQGSKLKNERKSGFASKVHTCNCSLTAGGSSEPQEASKTSPGGDSDTSRTTSPHEEGNYYG